jgi:hypothetical protein
LKRHQYYCRSKKTGTASRTRSCILCAKGKVRCDSKQPECSRCKSKGFECRYPNKSLNNKGQGNKNVATKDRRTTDSLVVDSPIVKNHQEASNEDTTVTNTMVAIPDLDFDLASLDTESFDWNDTAFDFTGFTSPKTNNETFSLDPSLSVDQLSLAQMQQSQPYVTSIPPSPTFNVHWMVKRPNIEKSSSRTANLIFHTLKSYPLMMLHRNTLPPFIHQDSISFRKIGNSSMDPIKNCIDLVNMIGDGVQGNRKLFWKNVGMECERICEEVR